MEANKENIEGDTGKKQSTSSGIEGIGIIETNDERNNNKSGKEHFATSILTAVFVKV